MPTHQQNGQFARLMSTRLSVPLDREELAWAAGFFDGEGNVSLHTQRKAAQLNISQCERSILDRFKNAVGGLGAVYGPYTRQLGDRSVTLWKYNCYGHERTQAIFALLSHRLGTTKRAQFERVLLGSRP
jgi:hypothetical protein